MIRNKLVLAFAGLLSLPLFAQTFQPDNKVSFQSADSPQADRAAQLSSPQQQADQAAITLEDLVREALQRYLRECEKRELLRKVIGGESDFSMTNEELEGLASYDSD